MTPYYPGGYGGNREEVHYIPETQYEKLVMDYLNISIYDVQEMPIDLYLYFRREAFISKNLETEIGREYLNNAWRVQQSKPDREGLRKKFKKR